MIKGTTPTIYFTINNEDLDLSTVLEAWITIEGKSKSLTWKKSKNRVFINEEQRKIYVTLTQEETLSFCDEEVSAQLRILFDNDTEKGMACASPVVSIKLDKILKKDIITAPPSESGE